MHKNAWGTIKRECLVDQTRDQTWKGICTLRILLCDKQYNAKGRGSIPGLSHQKCVVVQEGPGHTRNAIKPGCMRTHTARA